MPPGEPRKRSSNDPVSLLLHEWTICDAGLARYDTLAFNIRTWSMTVYGAALAASLAVDNGWHIPPVVLVLIAACWWTDGLYRTLQQQYMARTTEIQLELRTSLTTANSNLYLVRFLSTRRWIGPIFADVDKDTRDRTAIVHMSWQPHIRWFYFPLFVVALLGTSWVAIVQSHRQWEFDQLRVGAALLAVLVCAGLFMGRVIGKARQEVGRREERRKGEVEEKRKA